MRGEDPEWDQHKTFVDPWPAMKFLAAVGFIALVFAGFIWLLLKFEPVL
jgi:hypothetical protein